MAPSSVNHLVVSCLLGSALAFPLARPQRRDPNTASDYNSLGISVYDAPATASSTPYVSIQEDVFSWVPDSYTPVSIYNGAGDAPEPTAYARRRDAASQDAAFSNANTLSLVDAPTGIIASGDVPSATGDVLSALDAPAQPTPTPERKGTPVEVAVNESPSATPSHLGGLTLKARQDWSSDLANELVNLLLGSTGEDSTKQNTAKQDSTKRDISGSTLKARQDWSSDLANELVNLLLGSTGEDSTKQNTAKQDSAKRDTGKDDISSNNVSGGDDGETQIGGPLRARQDSGENQIGGLTSNSQTVDGDDTNANYVSSGSNWRRTARNTGSDSDSMNSVSGDSDSTSTSGGTQPDNYVSDESSSSTGDNVSGSWRLKARQSSSTNSGSDSASGNDNGSDSAGDSSSNSSGDNGNSGWRLKARHHSSTTTSSDSASSNDNGSDSAGDSSSNSSSDNSNTSGRDSD